MKAFVCVYRHPIISAKDWQKVQNNAVSNHELRSFLEHYANLSSWYDWGDDPSFFQAIQRWGDPRRASWGVCRPNVRRQLAADDLVIFICACEGPGRTRWTYFYIGYGTVQRSLQREEVFTKEAYGDYRSFFNLISRWEGGRRYQYEVFEGNHDNYDNRCLAGYILFRPEATDFNLENPLPLATYEPGDPGERWFTDPLAVELRSTLWLDGTIPRQMNSGNWRRPHVHIPLHKHLEMKERLAELRDMPQKLAAITGAIRSR